MQRDAKFLDNSYFGITILVQKYNCIFVGQIKRATLTKNVDS